MELRNKKKHNAWKTGNGQILGNIGIWHQQTWGDEKKNLKNSISGELGSSLR